MPGLNPKPVFLELQLVQTLMQLHGIRAKGKRRFKVTTDSDHVHARQLGPYPADLHLLGAHGLALSALERALALGFGPAVRPRRPRPADSA